VCLLITLLKVLGEFSRMVVGNGDMFRWFQSSKRCQGFDLRRWPRRKPRKR
jgi:hypothetical protein